MSEIKELPPPPVRESVASPMLTISGMITEVGGIQYHTVTISTEYGRFDMPISKQMAIDFAKCMYRNVRITVELRP